jgi:Flp pilus assembly pilin Flp
MSIPSPLPALPARQPSPSPTATPPATPSTIPIPSPASAIAPTTVPPAAPSLDGPVGRARRRAAGDDRGQASAEYGLVVIVAATIAAALIAWATQTGAITGFFDAVVERLTGFL